MGQVPESMQDEKSAVETSNAPQATQTSLVAPVALDALPWSHEMQARALLEGPKVPGAHVMHSPVNTSGPNSPAKHGSQVSVPESHPVPAMQVKQSAALNDPSKDQSPSRQLVHAVDPPVDENLPGSHAVHGVAAPEISYWAPDVEYWPAEHWQASAFGLVVIPPFEP